MESKVKLIYGENAAGKSVLFDKLKNNEEYKRISINDLPDSTNIKIYSESYRKHENEIMDILHRGFVWIPEEIKSIKPITVTVAKKEIKNLFGDLDGIEIINELGKYKDNNFIFPLRSLIDKTSDFMKLLSEAKKENISKERYKDFVLHIIQKKVTSEFTKKWKKWGGSVSWEKEILLTETSQETSTYKFLDNLTTAKLSKLSFEDVNNWEVSGDIVEWKKYSLYSNLYNANLLEELLSLKEKIINFDSEQFKNIKTNLDNYKQFDYFKGLKIIKKDNYKYQIIGTELSRGQITLIHLFKEISFKDQGKILLIDDLLETLDYINWAIVLEILQKDKIFNKILILTHNIPKISDEIEIERINKSVLDDNFDVKKTNLSLGKILTPKNAYNFMTSISKSKITTDDHIINLTIRIFMRDIYKLDRISSSFKKYALGENKKQAKVTPLKHQYIGTRLYSYNSDFLHDRVIGKEYARYFGFSKNFVKKIFGSSTKLNSLTIINKVIVIIKGMKSITKHNFSRDDILAFWQSAADRVRFESVGKPIPKKTLEQIHRLDSSKLTK